jgi:hypothetical protein
MKSFKTFARAGLAVAALLTSAATSFAKDPNIASYFIGVDGLETIPSGTFATLPNPNYGRLTFLYAHTYVDTPASNHYHSKGVFRYAPSSTFASPVIEQNPNNFLPEGTRPPLSLTLAVGGAYDGKLVSAPYTDPLDTNYAFSFLTIQDTGKLDGFGPTDPETILFNSSSGRWNGSLSGADVHIELVSLSAGLNVGVGSNLNAFVDPGDDYHLEDSFSFTPTFWTEASAAPGTYIAQFKLTDESGTFLDSGIFEFRFSVIPEPSSAAALAGALALGLVATRRRRRA